MNKSFPAITESVTPLVEYVSATLEKNKVNPKPSYEYQLMVEEIVFKLAPRQDPTRRSLWRCSNAWGD